MRVLHGGGELQEKVVFILPEDALYGIFPTLLKFPLRLCADVHMVGLIGQQDDLFFLEIFVGQRVLFGIGQVGMQLLDGSETDVDVVLVDAFKVVNRRHVYGIGDTVSRCATARKGRGDGFVKEVFGGAGIEKVVSGLGNDVGGVDEEEKVPVALIVEVKDQSCHD
ncbi:MAG: hypothetical protein OXI80_08440 [Caldilineaceae bacterium]|nr:hypothetical protein [Caldilineaceae bacterium]MDE0337686.1 hypothetical protein [Caldilineaceae bacterium]